MDARRDAPRPSGPPPPPPKPPPRGGAGGLMMSDVIDPGIYDDSLVGQDSSPAADVHVGLFALSKTQP